MGNEELESEFSIGIELIIRLLGFSGTGNFRPVLGTTSFLGLKTQRCRSVCPIKTFRLEFEEETKRSFCAFCPF